MNGIRTNGSRVTPLAVASGAIASFDAQVAAPLKILKADINPVQEGSGDPYPPGGGINKWDEEWEVGSYNASGVKVDSTTTIRSVNKFSIEANTTYYYYNGAGVAAGARFYGQDETFLSSLTLNANNTFTTPANAYYMAFVVLAAYGTTYNNDIAINYPSSTTSYAPYSNIRPISGWDEIKITNESGEIFEAANIVATESEIKAYYDADLVLSKGTYVFSTDATDSVTLIGAQYYSGSWVNLFTQIGTSRKFTLSRSGKCHFRAELRGSGDLSSNTVSLKQLDERTIELPDTVYGGKLDVIKGVGSKTWSDKFIVDGSVSVVNVAQSGGVYYISVRTNLTGVNTTASNKTVISDKMKTSTGLVADNRCYITNGGASLVCILSDQNITTKEQANQWFSDNPTTFCYELATPTALATDPISMDTYAGSNKITTDSGNTTACYLKGVTT